MVLMPGTITSMALGEKEKPFRKRVVVRPVTPPASLFLSTTFPLHLTPLYIYLFVLPSPSLSRLPLLPTTPLPFAY